MVPVEPFFVFTFPHDIWHVRVRVVQFNTVKYCTIEVGDPSSSILMINFYPILQIEQVSGQIIVGSANRIGAARVSVGGF